MEIHLGWNIQFAFQKEGRSFDMMINGSKVHEAPVAATGTHEHKDYNEEIR